MKVTADNQYHVSHQYILDLSEDGVQYVKESALHQLTHYMLDKLPFREWLAIKLHEKTIYEPFGTAEYHVWAEVSHIPTRHYEMYEPPPAPGKTRVYLDLTDGELVQLVLKRWWKLRKLKVKLAWIKMKMWALDVQVWGIVISRRVLTPKMVLWTVMVLIMCYYV